MAFSRYGLTESPNLPGPVAMQYVDAGHGGWSINCLSCHGGKVLGKSMPGLPNSHYAMQTFSDEVRMIKARQGKLTRSNWPPPRFRWAIPTAPPTP